MRRKVPVPVVEIMIYGISVFCAKDIVLATDKGNAVQAFRDEGLTQAVTIKVPVKWFLARLNKAGTDAVVGVAA